MPRIVSLTRPAPRSPGINWNHPLAQGLCAYWPCWEGFDINITDCVLAKPSSAGLYYSIRNSNSDLGLMGNSGTGYGLNTSMSIVNLPALTLLWWGYFTGAYSTLNVIDKSVGWKGWRFGPYWDSSGKTIFAVDYATTDLEANYATLLPNGSYAHIVLTWDGTVTPSTGVNVYKNGVYVAQSSSTTGVGARSNDDGVPLQYRTLGSTHMLYALGVWRRALSAAEALDLYNDPWALLTSVPTRIPTFSSSALPGFSGVSRSRTGSSISRAAA